MAKRIVCEDGFIVPTEDEIKEKLSYDNGWITRAIVVLYERQTLGERVCHQTHNKNNVGFSAFDAEILSSFAEQLVVYKRALTQRQYALAAKKLPKYWAQIQDEIIKAHGGLEIERAYE